MKDYRRLYAETFGIEWDREKYEVHHIDGNRENNMIDNLILLPKDLHRKIHSVMMGNGSSTPGFSLTVEEAVQNFMHSYLNGYSYWDIEIAIPAIIDVVRECQPFAFLKRMCYYKPGGEKIIRIE